MGRELCGNDMEQILQPETEYQRDALLGLGLFQDWIISINMPTKPLSTNYLSTLLMSLNVKVSRVNEAMGGSSVWDLNQVLCQFGSSPKASLWS